MPTASAHGGQCCGIKHIYSFGPGASLIVESASIGRKAEADQLTTALNSYRSLVPGILTEVVLIPEQCSKERLKLLKDNGFFPAFSFINGNSGRECFVFHRYDANGVSEVYPAHWTGGTSGIALGYNRDGKPADWETCDA